MKRGVLFLIGLFMWLPAAHGQAPFEQEVVNVGNTGLTITNAGFIGRSNVRNAPTGPPSFEYPLNSGIEHLFEAGLWIGAIRASDGATTVRTGAVTSSSGYSTGAAGYELYQLEPIRPRSSLPSSDFFSPRAVSQQDFLTAYSDTSRTVPGTSVPTPDPQGALGAKVEQTSYAWGFPFTESFVIVNFDIINTSEAAWDSVYVGLFHDLVVRNVNTTTESGSAFFNKGGLGYIDSLQTSYAFNAGGQEETQNTYGAVSFLGGEWTNPATGRERFFHPSVAERYQRDGLTRPYLNPRWWKFSGGQAELTRPGGDQARYQRMSTPYPNPAVYEGCVSPGPPPDVLNTDCQDPSYRQAVRDWYERLRTDGLQGSGNWIGLTPVGPARRVAPGDTLTMTFAFVAALKPEPFQGQAEKRTDTEASRRILRENVDWARRTYAGEDNNYNGRLDPGEDVNNNGQLDRYLIPEPPRAPNLRVEFEDAGTTAGGQQDTRVALYWGKRAERSIDPITGETDFEGYRIYRSSPGDDQAGGNILNEASLVAQFDSTVARDTLADGSVQVRNREGFNNGFEAIRLDEPVTFEGDSTEYYYKYVADDLSNGWQYLFTVTAFDEGAPEAGLPSFSSSRTTNATRVFPGTPPADGSGDGERPEVGVYPNPYRVRAAWDGESSRNRQLNFYNLPPRSEIRIFTLAGELVKRISHDAATYEGDSRWYETFSGPNRQVAGGEHSWDILSENNLDISSGLYLYSVENLKTGDIQRGKFVIIK
jgi:hypothetical protein